MREARREKETGQIYFAKQTASSKREMREEEKEAEEEEEEEEEDRWLIQCSAEGAVENALEQGEINVLKNRADK